MPTSRSPSLEPGEQHGCRDAHQQRGQQPAGPAGPEAGQVDAAAGDALAHEQGGDEEAGDDEEDVDAEEPAGQPATGRGGRRGPRRWPGRAARRGRPAARPLRAAVPGLPVADLCVAPGRGGHGSAVSLHRAHAATVGAGGDRVTEARSWGRDATSPPYDRSRARDRWRTRRRAADDGVRARPGAGRGVPLVDPRPRARAGPRRATPATPTTAGSRWSPRVTRATLQRLVDLLAEQPSAHRRPGRVDVGVGAAVGQPPRREHLPRAVTALGPSGQRCGLGDGFRRVPGPRAPTALVQRAVVPPGPALRAS